jgi:putative hemolysin
MRVPHGRPERRGGAHPRPEIIGLDVAAPHEENWGKMVRSGHIYFPVYDEHLDNVLGIVSVREIWARMLADQPVDIEALLRRPFFVPGSIPVLRVLELFKNIGDAYRPRHRRARQHSGPGDLPGHPSIIGDISSTDEEVAESRVIQREIGSRLIDGMIGFVEFRERFSLGQLPGEEKGSFQTLGGFMMMQLECIPAPGDYVEWGGLQFEMVDMDGNRVDRVLVTPRE